MACRWPIVVAGALTCGGCSSTGFERESGGEGGVRADAGEGGLTLDGTAGDDLPTGCGSSSASPEAAGAGVWLSLDDRSAYEAEPFVAIRPDGAWVAAWIAKGCDGRTRIGYRSGARGDAGSFGPIHEVESPRGQEASDPVLAFDATGGAHLVWASYSWDSGGEPVDIHVYFASAAPGSDRFDASLELSEPRSASPIVDKPWLTALADGTLLATYGDLDVGGIVVASSVDEGATFRQARIEEGAVGTNFASSCATGSGAGADIVYYYYSGALDEIRTAHTDDGGLTWSRPISVAVDAGSSLVAVDGPTCVARGSEWWVCYGRTLDLPDVEVNRLTSVHVAHFTQGDPSAATDALVFDGGTGFLLHPQLVQASNGALAVAAYRVQGPDAPMELVVASSTDQGATWSEPAVVATGITPVLERHVPRWLGDYFGIAPLAGEIALAYTDNVMGNSHIAWSTLELPLPR